MIFVNMLTYNTSTNRFENLKYKVNYTLNNVDTLKYTNEIDQYIAYSKANPNITNFTYTLNTLDNDQETRLNIINTAKFNQNDCITYITDFSLFVQYAYIKDDCPIEFLKNKKSEYDPVSISLFVKKAAELIKDIRKEKEAAGVAFAGKIVDTDRDSQQSITSSVVMLQSKLVSTINYKCQNNEYLFNLTLSDMLSLSATVSTYVQTCYTAEAGCSSYLTSLQPSDIVEYISEDKVKARELYEKTFKTIYEEAKKAMDSNLKIAQG